MAYFDWSDESLFGPCDGDINNPPQRRFEEWDFEEPRTDDENDGRNANYEDDGNSCDNGQKIIIFAWFIRFELNLFL